MKKAKKANTKAIIISTITIVSIIAVLIFVFVVSPNIIVDDGPCGWCNEKICVDAVTCPKITLYDVITGQSR